MDPVQGTLDPEDNHQFGECLDRAFWFIGILNVGILNVGILNVGILNVGILNVGILNPINLVSV